MWYAPMKPTIPGQSNSVAFRLSLDLGNRKDHRKDISRLELFDYEVPQPLRGGKAFPRGLLSYHILYWSSYPRAQQGSLGLRLGPRQITISPLNQLNSNSSLCWDENPLLPTLPHRLYNHALTRNLVLMSSLRMVSTPHFEDAHPPLQIVAIVEIGLH